MVNLYLLDSLHGYCSGTATGRILPMVLVLDVESISRWNQKAGITKLMGYEIILARDNRDFCCSSGPPGKQERGNVAIESTRNFKQA